MPISNADFYRSGPHDDHDDPFEGDEECLECGNITFNPIDGCSDCGYFEEDEPEEEGDDD